MEHKCIDDFTAEMFLDIARKHSICRSGIICKDDEVVIDTVDLERLNLICMFIETNYGPPKHRQRQCIRNSYSLKHEVEDSMKGLVENYVSNAELMLCMIALGYKPITYSPSIEFPTRRNRNCEFKVDTKKEYNAGYAFCQSMIGKKKRRFTENDYHEITDKIDEYLVESHFSGENDERLYLHAVGFAKAYKEFVDYWKFAFRSSFSGLNK